MGEFSDRRILIVDDVRDNVDVLVAALRGDYKLSVALDGQQALQLLDKAAPDLVLLDIVMPGLGGYEVCRRIRQRPELADVPVMFLSALHDSGSKVEGFEAGGNDYITKPIEVVELRARVRSLIKAKAFSDAQKQRLASELLIASEIQKSVLPRDPAAFASARLDVCFQLDPARDVGGDLYVLEWLPGHQLGFAIGDVSGKGLAAAMFMLVASTLLKTTLRTQRDPARVLAIVNDELARDNAAQMFITVTCGIFDVGSGRVRYAVGGHTPLVVRNAQGQTHLDEGPLGTALGLEPGLEFPVRGARLAPGDALVLYTDGVTEAFDPQRALFGDARLLAALAGGPVRHARDLVEGTVGAVRAFAQGAPQSDDLAVLALRRPEVEA